MENFVDVATNERGLLKDFAIFVTKFIDFSDSNHLEASHKSTFNYVGHKY